MLKVVELRASLINLALLAFSTTSVSVTAADLTIQVTGVSSDDGTVRVALHDGAEGFPRDRQMIAGRFANASTQGVTLIFKDVAPGRYAISAFHDLDGDEALSTNLLGIPTEPFGFSNNAVGSFGPPDFEDAAFTVQDADHLLTFSLGE